jgi:hypothetical protein
MVGIIRYTASLLMGCVVLVLACKAFRAAVTGIPHRAWNMSADTRVGFGWRLAAMLGGSIFFLIALLLILAPLPLFLSSSMVKRYIHSEQA